METAQIIKYAWIAIGIIICISVKLYFGSNPVVNAVDKGIEEVVQVEEGYDISPIVNAV